jgi:xanthine dehydrogenase small subunit
MISLVLNGRRVEVADPLPQTTLLDFIRSQGLTGAKEGCAEGECGACAVALLEPFGAGSVYRVVNSCLMFLPMAADREVYTVEALAQGGLSQAQRAMAEAGGSQCGYCTPGFVVSLFAEQHRPDRSGACDTAALHGNLCRCTGYRPIRDAAASLGQPPATALRDRLEAPPPELNQVAIDGFSRPRTIEECLAILQTNPGARIVAGGTDTGVESNLLGWRGAHLVSLDAIEELTAFSNEPARLRIGAGLSLSELGRRWLTAPAAVAEWLELFASPLIRNRATLGGNLATASPIGDGAPLLLALDARLEIAGSTGRRSLPLADFFVDYRKTALAPGEIITAVEIPKPVPSSLRFYKVAKRRLDDISTVAAAFAIERRPDGIIEKARFALGGVAATPVRVKRAEEIVVGQSWTDALVEQVQAVFDTQLVPISDHRGSREYRLEVSKSLVAKYRWELRQ